MILFKPGDKVRCIKETKLFTVGKIYTVKKFHTIISRTHGLNIEALENYAYIPYDNDLTNGRIANLDWLKEDTFILVNSNNRKAPKWL